MQNPAEANASFPAPVSGPGWKYSTIAAHAVTLWTLAAAIGLTLIVSAAVFGLDTAFRSERGGTEMSSLALAIYGCVLTALMSRETNAVSRLVPGVFLLLALREMDFHDWFFEPGLLHVSIFSDPVPVWQKLVSGTAILAILALASAATYRGVPILWRALKQRETWALVLCGAALLAATANSLDGIGRKLAPIGIEVSEGLSAAIEIVEESFELAFVFGLIAAISLYTRRHILPNIGSPRG